MDKELIDDHGFLALLKQSKGNQSLEQFSSIFGVTPGFMSMVLNGIRNPGYKIAIKMGFIPTIAYKKIKRRVENK